MLRTAPGGGHAQQQDAAAGVPGREQHLVARQPVRADRAHLARACTHRPQPSRGADERGYAAIAIPAALARMPC